MAFVLSLSTDALTDIFSHDRRFQLYIDEEAMQLEH